MLMTDLIIIGCGPGGYTTAAYAARHGLTVTIFEKGELGGTCLNVGCIPTKILCHIGEIFGESRAVADFEAFTDCSNIDGGADMCGFKRWKAAVLDQLHNGLGTLMSSPGITLVKGEAVFKSAHTVSCDGRDYEARHIIIATGSRPAKLPIPMKSFDVKDTDDFFDFDTTKLLDSLTIIGGGVIGMEIASAFSLFGRTPTVIEYLKECLPSMDQDLAKRLRKILEKRGVTFHLQSAATAIINKTVLFEHKGENQAVESDLILMATGRTPNTNGIGLDTVGIDYDRHGIKTDDNLMTSVPDIYAIGDVNGRQMLAHAAEMQGRQVVDHLLGIKRHYRPDLVPSAVFTYPELAAVGPTEQQLKAEGRKYKVYKSSFRSNGRAVLMCTTEGLVKLIADDNDRLIACHVLGNHAADIVQEATALIQMGATVEDLRTIVHIHPTVNEVLRDAVE